MIKNITRDMAARLREEAALYYSQYYNASISSSGNTTNGTTNGTGGSISNNSSRYVAYNITLLAEAISILSSYNDTQLASDVALYLSGQETLRPVSQAYSLAIGIRQSLVKSYFSMAVPVDLRVRYVLADSSTAGRRLLLQQSAASYTGYLQYPDSTSVVRQTLQAYWLSPTSNLWVIVPTQSLSADGTSITLRVTREMVLASPSGKVVIAAFAVSQPPPTAQQVQGTTLQQAQTKITDGTSTRVVSLAATLLPSLQMADIYAASKLQPASAQTTPLPATTTPSQGPATSTPAPEASPPPSMSPGAIAGVVVGCLCLAVVAAMACMMMRGRSKNALNTAAELSRAKQMEPLMGAPRRNAIFDDRDNGGLETRFRAAGISLARDVMNIQKKQKPRVHGHWR